MQIIREGEISFNREPRVNLQLLDNRAVCLILESDDVENRIYGVSWINKLNQILNHAPGIVGTENFEGEQLRRLVHFHKPLSSDYMKATMYPIASIDATEDKTVGVLSHTDLPSILLWDKVKGYENCVQLIREFADVLREHRNRR